MSRKFDPLALDEAPDVGRVEALGVGLDEHGAAAEPRPKAPPSGRRRA